MTRIKNRVVHFDIHFHHKGFTGIENCLNCAEGFGLIGKAKGRMDGLVVEQGIVIQHPSFSDFKLSNQAKSNCNQVFQVHLFDYYTNFTDKYSSKDFNHFTSPNN